jgi:hypothetical protein
MDSAYIPPNQRLGAFIGRRRELDRLQSLIFQKPPVAIIVTGLAGIGKTTLIREYISNYMPANFTADWISFEASPDPVRVIDEYVTQLQQGRDTSPRPKRRVVILDAAEGLITRGLERSLNRIFNYKIVQSVIATSRPLDRVSLKKSLRLKTIHLEPLSQEELTTLTFELFGNLLTDQQIQQFIATTHANLAAINALYSLIDKYPFSEILKMLEGKLYGLEDHIIAPQKKIIQIVAPQIIATNDTLIHHLKREPEDLYKISPRKFEEVIADLLTDMGMEVELTQETRDGGKDILAYMNTEIGKLLCLVEAKQHNKNRPVGVSLVRTLFGTLVDHQATTGMLVTTSRFSQDAKTFQERHQYQLSLKDYGDVVSWLLRYKMC